MNVCCEPLDYHFELPERPERIVSLNAGTTETLVSLGCSDRLAAISPFCGHYSPGLDTCRCRRKSSMRRRMENPTFFSVIRSPDTPWISPA